MITPDVDTPESDGRGALNGRPCTVVENQDYRGIFLFLTCPESRSTSANEIASRRERGRT
jgi:hypothetical protein